MTPASKHTALEAITQSLRDVTSIRGTEGQEFNLEIPRVSKPQLDPANPLHQALSRLGHALKEERSRA